MNKLYPKVVNDHIDRLNSQIFTVRNLLKQAKLAEFLASKHPEIVQGISIDVYAPSVSLSLYPKKMSDLATVLRLLANKGYRIKKIDDNPEYGYRFYTLDKSMRVTAHFTMSENEIESTGNKQCRYVKVDEKRETKEIVTPIYKLKCD